jgi:mannose-6-phosphate isomerase-like protein (cupin superfamily)
MACEKKIVTQPNEAPTYESVTPDHRRFQLLCDPNYTGSRELCAGTVTQLPGQCQPGEACHPETEEIYYVLKGRGRISVGGQMYDVEEGTFIYIPPNTTHRIFNTDEKEELHIFWANTPSLATREGYKPLKDREGWRIFGRQDQAK